MPALLLASQPPIYKSTDERGRVTYSSDPPADAVDVERVEVEQSSPSANENAGERTQQMMDVANQFAQERLEQERIREKRRAEERQLAREMEQFRRQQALLDQVGRSYNRGYFWPYRPIHVPHPGHPVAKPHPKPSPGQPGGGHSGITLPIHRSGGH
jgi:hypothetical protein